jgi:hypothetical protein
MSNQTTNTTNGLGYGTQFTRYVLSPAQQTFLKRLQHWLINSNSQPPCDPLQVMEYISLVARILKQDGYDEEDRFIINHIRYLYLKDKDTLPF